MHIMSGYKEPDIRCPQVKLALRSVHETSGPPSQREVINYKLLQQLYPLLDHEQHTVMWRAMLCLAFFAGLRGGEYSAVTVDRVTRFPTLSQITFGHAQGSKVLYYTLLKTKTQAHGYTVPLGCTGVEICPYCSMLKYVHYNFNSVTVNGAEPLFNINGVPVTKDKVNNMIKSLVTKLGLDNTMYSTHSIRAGAASSAAALGFQDWEIMRLGGWGSSAYRRYIRQLDSHVAGFAARLATTN